MMAILRTEEEVKLMTDSKSEGDRKSMLEGEQAFQLFVNTLSEHEQMIVKNSFVRFEVDFPFSKELLLNHCRIFKRRFSSKQCSYHFVNKDLAEITLGIEISESAWEFNGFSFEYCNVHFSSGELDRIRCFKT